MSTSRKKDPTPPVTLRVDVGTVDHPTPHWAAVRQAIGLRRAELLAERKRYPRRAAKTASQIDAELATLQSLDAYAREREQQVAPAPPPTPAEILFAGKTLPSLEQDAAQADSARRKAARTAVKAAEKVTWTGEENEAEAMERVGKLKPVSLGKIRPSPRTLALLAAHDLPAFAEDLRQMAEVGETDFFILLGKMLASGVALWDSLDERIARNYYSTTEFPKPLAECSEEQGSEWLHITTASFDKRLQRLGIQRQGGRPRSRGGRS